eukprot:TRINITY_DN1056_c0_g1_i4.p1 TRINITY_DN1056_c0_g1~~TRINITY_DN1056_c0_g1_i4.p1  ORF type:complete len:652 (-),score=183.45 TRINITY_DN1056_c0_g1_i4:633-2588(-)
MVWTCGVCSVENVDARTRCGACGTDKPKGASKSKSVASSPAKRSAPAAAPKRPTPATGSSASAAVSAGGGKNNISDATVTELMMMGFSEAHVRHALAITSSQASAINWMISNPEAPSPVEQKSSASSSSKSKPIPTPSKPVPTPGRAKNSGEKPSGPSSAPVSSKAPIATPVMTNESLIANVEQMGFSRSHIAESIAVNGLNPPAVIKWLIDNPQKSAPAPTSSQFYKAPTGNVQMLKLTPEQIQRNLEEALREEQQRQEHQPKVELKSEESITVEDIRKINLDRRAEMEKIRIQERNARMIQLKEQEELELKKAAERQEKRDQVENSFEDIPSALKYIKKTYGVESLVSVAKAVLQVLTNIQEHVDDPKFRTIRETSRFIMSNFEPHHGSYAILRLLGFQKVQGKFVMESVDVDLINSELAKFRKVAEITKSSIADLLSSVEGKTDPDDRVFALMSLEKIASNLSVNPTAIFSKTVPTTDEMFQGTLLDVAETDIVLSELGFVKNGDMYVIQGEVDIRLAVRVEKDLAELIDQEIAKTKIYLAVVEAKEKNDLSACKRVVKLLRKSFENVIADPHASKFHRILLKKLLGAKFPAGMKLLDAVGLQLQKESETVIFPYPHPRGVVRLERILAVLDLSVKKLGLDQSEGDLS